MDAKLQDKLSKILALTTSPNEHEAAVASAMLKDLLTKHNLSVADLEKKGAKAPSVNEQRHDLGKAAFTWKLNLAEAIAEHFYCHPLVDRRAKTVRFIGRPDNVESLLMLYAWLIEQIRQISASERKDHQTKTGEHVDPLRWQVNFGIGVVSRLGDRLHEVKARQQEDMARNEDGDVVALAVHHATEISDYLEQEYHYREDGQETKYQREEREKAEAEVKRRADWLARDPKGYYEAYPHLHPDRVAEREEEQRKIWEKMDKEEERRQKRRDRYIPRFREEREPTEAELRQQAQASDAKAAGARAAAKVNLEPFLKGHVPADEGKRLHTKKGGK